MGSKKRMLPENEARRIAALFRRQERMRRELEETEEYCSSPEFAALPAKRQAEHLEALANMYYRRVYHRPYIEPEEAEEALGKAYAILHELAEQPEEDLYTAEFRWAELANLCTAYVEMYRDNPSYGSLADAERYAEEAVRNYGGKNTYALGRVYRLLGACALQREAPGKALDCYRKAETFWRKDKSADRTAGKREIAELCTVIGGIYGNLGRRNEQYEYRTEAFRILSGLKEQGLSGDPDADTLSYWTEFGQSALRLAEVLRELGRAAKAEQCCRIALSVYDTACCRYDDACLLADEILKAQNFLADLCEETGRTAEAETYRTDENTVLRNIRRLRKTTK